MNPLRELQKLGQSIWLDYIRRDLMTGGEFKRLIEEDGLSGVTSNPTIFAKALAGDSEYDDAIQRILAESPEITAPTLFEKIEIEDLQMAADALRAVFERTDGKDGFASIEVSPHLAYDTRQSILEARRLWAEVARPNLMVKIPATAEGLPAIEQLVSEGINVNITLIFSVSQYEEVVEAYLRGMKRNSEPRKVTSVASLFVSRVDTAVDTLLEEVGTEEAKAVRGKAGIVNASLAYRRFREVFFGLKFEDLKRGGVRIQKPLWASTGTKNKAYSDVMYIEGLIAPDKINSVPPETIEAFRKHGKARVALSENTEDAQETIGKLVRMGINLHSIGQELTDQGVEKFVKSYDELIQGLEKKMQSIKRAA
jgi:transaldolase